VFSKKATGEIKKMSPISGDNKGNEDVTIEGKGFGANKDDVKVFIGRNKCDVKSVVDDKVVCKTSTNKEKIDN